jgi:hypothetical protein
MQRSNSITMLETHSLSLPRRVKYIFLTLLYVYVCICSEVSEEVLCMSKKSSSRRKEEEDDDNVRLLAGERGNGYHLSIYLACGTLSRFQK